MIPSFVLPDWVKRHDILTFDSAPKELLQQIKNGLSQFHTDEPEISIVIPAYNEEKEILKTLSSLSEIKSAHKIELIITNNNSTDRTQAILDELGVKSVFVEKQGIIYARQAGLHAAKGTYILNGDSDSVYPSDWVDGYIKKMRKSDVSCAYGRYSFIPYEGNNRFTLAVYEFIARLMFFIKSLHPERKFANVPGCNFCFRRAEALKVGGYNQELNIGGEDGRMAMSLKPFGKLVINNTTVWTSDRRLMVDGGLGKAFIRRIIKEITRHFKK